jgi:hypothetical protein
VRDGGDPLTVDAVFGAAALLVSVVALGRGRRDRPAEAVVPPAPSRHSRGSHAR